MAGEYWLGRESVSNLVRYLRTLMLNDNPKPFIWTARASDVLGKVKRPRRALHKRQSA